MSILGISTLLFQLWLFIYGFPVFFLPDKDAGISDTHMGALFPLRYATTGQINEFVFL